VEQLGFTEAAAKEFSIGFYRGQVYIPIRHSGGSISGFVGYADGQMKLPPKWLPATSHVVTVSKVRKKKPRTYAGAFLLLPHARYRPRPRRWRRSTQLPAHNRATINSDTGRDSLG